ncbi:MAG TPA: hypothetical protein VGN98_12365 [Tianweitania sediminis]|jgi:hypothetical protein|nr:hypothetical protein [Tianweitania sediminis]
MIQQDGIYKKRDTIGIIAALFLVAAYPTLEWTLNFQPHTLLGCDYTIPKLAQYQGKESGLVICRESGRLLAAFCFMFACYAVALGIGAAAAGVTMRPFGQKLSETPWESFKLLGAFAFLSFPYLIYFYGDLSLSRSFAHGHALLPIQDYANGQIGFLMYLVNPGMFIAASWMTHVFIKRYSET